MGGCQDRNHPRVGPDLWHHDTPHHSDHLHGRIDVETQGQRGRHDEAPYKGDVKIGPIITHRANASSILSSDTVGLAFAQTCDTRHAAWSMQPGIPFCLSTSSGTPVLLCPEFAHLRECPIHLQWSTRPFHHSNIWAIGVKPFQRTSL